MNAQAVCEKCGNVAPSITDGIRHADGSGHGSYHLEAPGWKPAVDIQPVTIPAYGPGECLLLKAPVAWHERIRALTYLCCYGVDHQRRIVDSLVDVREAVRTGYLGEALKALEAAERFAAPVQS